MNKDIRYVIQGAFLALVLAIAVRAVLYYTPENFFKHQQPDIAIIPKKDSIHVIANIAGQILFQEHCTACHHLHRREQVSIKGVEKRVKDRVLLREWIRNSSKVLQSGNLYFNNLVKECGGVRMNDFPQLTDAEIDAMLDYIKEVEENDLH